MRYVASRSDRRLRQQPLPLLLARADEVGVVVEVVAHEPRLVDEAEEGDAVPLGDVLAGDRVARDREVHPVPDDLAVARQVEHDGVPAALETGLHQRLERGDVAVEALVELVVEEPHPSAGDGVLDLPAQRWPRVVEVQRLAHEGSGVADELELRRGAEPVRVDADEDERRTVGQAAHEVQVLGEALVTRAEVARDDRRPAGGGDGLAPAAVVDRRLTRRRAAGQHHDRRHGLVGREPGGGVEGVHPVVAAEDRGRCRGALSGDGEEQDEGGGAEKGARRRRAPAARRRAASCSSLGGRRRRAQTYAPGLRSGRAPAYHRPPRGAPGAGAGAQPGALTSGARRGCARR